MESIFRVPASHLVDVATAAVLVVTAARYTGATSMSALTEYAVALALAAAFQLFLNLLPSPCNAFEEIAVRRYLAVLMLSLFLEGANTPFLSAARVSAALIALYLLMSRACG